MEQSAGIAVRSLGKSYFQGSETLRIFGGVEFVVEPCSFVAIIGPSGMGKSTLLNLLCGLDTDYEGEIRINGQVLGELPSSDIQEWRARNISIVFQSHHLIPVLSAFENVELPLLLFKLGRKERHERVRAALDLVGLGPRARHLPKSLSGGEQQRVGIARAIVSGSRFIFCDEPTGNLNKELGKEIVELLISLCRNHGKTVIVVTHDMDIAAVADRVFRIDDGKLQVEAAHAAAAAVL